MAKSKEPVKAAEAAPKPAGAKRKRTLKEWFLAVIRSRPVREMGAELKHMGGLGSQELAAALFSGSAFVMYSKPGRGGPADDGGVHGPAERFDALVNDKTPPTPPAKEAGRERGGIEM